MAMHIYHNLEIFAIGAFLPTRYDVNCWIADVALMVSCAQSILLQVQLMLNGVKSLTIYNRNIN